MAIVIAMVFTWMPEDKLFDKDTTFHKLRGNDKVTHRLRTLESLGYLDYMSIGEMCSISEVDDLESCNTTGSEIQNEVLAQFEKV